MTVQHEESYSSILPQGSPNRFSLRRPARNINRLKRCGTPISQVRARRSGALTAISAPRNGGYGRFRNFGFCCRRRRVMQSIGQPSKASQNRGKQGIIRRGGERGYVVLTRANVSLTRAGLLRSPRVEEEDDCSSAGVPCPRSSLVKSASHRSGRLRALMAVESARSAAAGLDRVYRADSVRVDFRWDEDEGCQPAKSAGVRNAGHRTCSARSGRSTLGSTESSEPRVWFLESARTRRLQRLLKKSFWTLEEDKLKHVPHGKSTS
jgi:hypothetical protein